jgi:hypothetical protein
MRILPRAGLIDNDNFYPLYGTIYHIDGHVAEIECEGIGG